MPLYISSHFYRNLVLMTLAITSANLGMYFLNQQGFFKQPEPLSLPLHMQQFEDLLGLHEHTLDEKKTIPLTLKALSHNTLPLNLENVFVCTPRGHPHMTYVAGSEDHLKRFNKLVAKLGDFFLQERPSGVMIPWGKKWIICHYQDPWHVIVVGSMKANTTFLWQEALWAAFILFIGLLLNTLVRGYSQYRHQRIFAGLLRDMPKTIEDIKSLEGPWKPLLEEALVLIYALQNRLGDDETALDDNEMALMEASENLARAESQIIHQEKLAQLGTLTASVAHELRNPLNYILNFASLSESQLERLKKALSGIPTPPSLEALMLNTKKTIEHAKRANRIISGSLLHARREDGENLPHFDRVAVNPILREYKDLCTQHFKRLYPDIPLSVDLSLDPSVPEISVVDEDMHYIVVNLLNNAFEAIIEFYPSQTSQIYSPFIEISTNRHDNEVMICLKDNGPGISATNLRRICQPFFTTKRKGTGLGLFITQTCVERNKGMLHISSNPGEGTCVILKFPIPLSPLGPTN